MVKKRRTRKMTEAIKKEMTLCKRNGIPYIYADWIDFTIKCDGETIEEIPPMATKESVFTRVLDLRIDAADKAKELTR